MNVCVVCGGRGVVCASVPFVNVCMLCACRCVFNLFSRGVCTLFACGEGVTKIMFDR